MRTVVIFYSGETLPNTTKAIIANELVKCGVNPESIDMVELDNVETAKILAKKASIVINNEKKETNPAVHHAHVYVDGLLSKTFNNDSEFIVACIKELTHGNDRLRNALNILYRNKAEALRDGMLPRVLENITAICNSNLV